MTVACIVQARMGSKRFPGKVLAPLAGKPVLQHVLERCKEIKGVDVWACAIPQTVTPEEDNALTPVILVSGVTAICYGPEDDVLERYRRAATALQATVIMRITADCPFLDPEVCASVLALMKPATEYASNVFPSRSYPQGLDCEVFPIETLERAAAMSTDPEEREHVTLWMQRNCKQVACLSNSYDASHVRWTVDYPEDIARLEAVMRDAA